MASDTGSFSFSPSSVLETRIEDLVGQRQRPVLPPGRALFSPIIKSLAGQILSIFLPLIPSLSHLWLTLMIKKQRNVRHSRRDNTLFYLGFDDIGRHITMSHSLDESQPHQLQMCLWIYGFSKMRSFELCLHRHRAIYDAPKLAGRSTLGDGEGCTELQHQQRESYQRHRAR